MEPIDDIDVIPLTENDFIPDEWWCTDDCCDS